MSLVQLRHPFQSLPSSLRDTPEHLLKSSGRGCGSSEVGSGCFGSPDSKLYLMGRWAEPHPILTTSTTDSGCFIHLRYFGGQSGHPMNQPRLGVQVLTRVGHSVWCLVLTLPAVDPFKGSASGVDPVDYCHLLSDHAKWHPQPHPNTRHMLSMICLH